jgi:hypothetical protein
VALGFLRELFGPSTDEVWQQLSREIGADYDDGGFWRGGKVEAHVGSWTVTLDTYTVSTGKSSATYTRMRAPYVNADNFRFKIYRKGLFSDVGKLFGMQDVEVGDAELDRDFVIQGNDEQKLALLFRDPRIRDLIMRQPSIGFEVKDDEGWFGAPFPEGVDELYFQVHGVIKDVDRLKQLYELFAATLHHLCHIGSAYERDPQLRL